MNNNDILKSIDDLKKSIAFQEQRIVKLENEKFISDEEKDLNNIEIEQAKNAIKGYEQTINILKENLNK